MLETQWKSTRGRNSQIEGNGGGWGASREILGKSWNAFIFSRDARNRLYSLTQDTKLWPFLSKFMNSKWHHKFAKHNTTPRYVYQSVFKISAKFFLVFPRSQLLTVQVSLFPFPVVWPGLYLCLLVLWGSLAAEYDIRGDSGSANREPRTSNCEPAADSSWGKCWSVLLRYYGPRTTKMTESPYNAEGLKLLLTLPQFRLRLGVEQLEYFNNRHSLGHSPHYTPWKVYVKMGQAEQLDVLCCIPEALCSRNSLKTVSILALLPTSCCQQFLDNVDYYFRECMVPLRYTNNRFETIKPVLDPARKYHTWTKFCKRPILLMGQFHIWLYTLIRV
jgi:hypothetical protein